MINKTINSWYEMSDSAILEALGAFVKETRLQQNKTQEALAEACGIQRMTLTRVENGKGGTLSTFIRLLRSLEQLNLLNVFSAPTSISPIMLAKAEKRKRQRAGSPRKKPGKQDKPAKSDW